MDNIKDRTLETANSIQPPVSRCLVAQRTIKPGFYNAYLYMKYLHQFELLIMQGLPMPVNPGVEVVDPAQDAMLEANINSNIVRDASGNPETDICHAKVVSSEDARRLVSVNVRMEVPETVVPFKLARNIVLKQTDSFAAGTCPCRLAQAGCTCMPPPMEAYLFMGDPHASFIAEHNPRFRRVSRGEAAHILRDGHKRGFVHGAHFKKDMGNRLFAICNCCSCCCGGVNIHNLLSSKGRKGSHVAPSGYVAAVGEGCSGCQACLESCQFNAIGLADDRDRAVVDVEKCMGCGVCEDICPAGAMKLTLEPSKGGVLDVEELRQHLC